MDRLLLHLAVKTHVTVITSIHQSSSEVWPRWTARDATVSALKWTCSCSAMPNHLHWLGGAKRSHHIALHDRPCPRFLNTLQPGTRDHLAHSARPTRHRQAAGSPSASLVASDPARGSWPVSRPARPRVGSRPRQSAPRRQFGPPTAGSCKSNDNDKHVADLVPLCERNVFNNARESCTPCSRFSSASCASG